MQCGRWYVVRLQKLSERPAGGGDCAAACAAAVPRRRTFVALAKYSMWGSNPRPMAHKTIALTTELREPNKEMLFKKRMVQKKKEWTGYISATLFGFTNSLYSSRIGNAGYSSVGRASDCRSLQQSDGPWFDSGWPDFSQCAPCAQPKPRRAVLSSSLFII